MNGSLLFINLSCLVKGVKNSMIAQVMFVEHAILVVVVYSNKQQTSIQIHFNPARVFQSTQAQHTTMYTILYYGKLFRQIRFGCRIFNFKFVPLELIVPSFRQYVLSINTFNGVFLLNILKKVEIEHSQRISCFACDRWLA